MNHVNENDNDNANDNADIEALLRRQFDSAVADEGFSTRLMQRLPASRRRRHWPLWAGLCGGALAAAMSVGSSPLLQHGGRDLFERQWSPAAITLLLVMAGLSLLSLCWGLAEADDHVGGSRRAGSCRVH